MKTQFITISDTNSADELCIKLTHVFTPCKKPGKPQLKFDTEKGIWIETVEVSDQDEKVVYKPLDESQDFEVITAKLFVIHI